LDQADGAVAWSFVRIANLSVEGSAPHQAHRVRWKFSWRRRGSFTSARMGQAQGLNKFGCCGPDTDTEPNTTQPEPVTLNIYDLHGKDLAIFKGMNVLLRAAGTGAFHVGLEVFGQEWSFGHRDGSQTGVYSHAPRKSELHSYRASISMGDTDLTETEVGRLIKSMSLEWTGDSYDMLTRNCCHFCDELCMHFHVSRPSFVPLPEWVNSLAAAGATLAGVQDHEGSKEDKIPALDNSLGVVGKSSRRRKLVSATEDAPGSSSRAVHGRPASRQPKEKGGLSISIEFKW